MNTINTIWCDQQRAPYQIFKDLTMSAAKCNYGVCLKGTDTINIEGAVSAVIPVNCSNSYTQHSNAVLTYDYGVTAITSKKQAADLTANNKIGINDDIFRANGTDAWNSAVNPIVDGTETFGKYTKCGEFRNVSFAACMDSTPAGTYSNLADGVCLLRFAPSSETTAGFYAMCELGFTNTSSYNYQESAPYGNNDMFLSVPVLIQSGAVFYNGHPFYNTAKETIFHIYGNISWLEYN